MPILETTQWGTDTPAPTTGQGTAPSAPSAEKKPSSFTDLLGAHWDQGIWGKDRVRQEQTYSYDKSFDYKSYDQKYWPYVGAARNDDHARAIVQQVDAEEKNRAVQQEHGFLANLAAGSAYELTNPLNFIGFGAGGTVAFAAGKAALGAVVGTALTEPVLQSKQVTRTAAAAAMDLAGAALFGAHLGGAARAIGIGAKAANGKFLAAEAENVAKVLGADATAAVPFGGGQSVGAARAVERTMADAKLSTIPFLPKSWTEPIVRFSMYGNFGRSANQRLSTSSFTASRNAQNLMLRSALDTAENVAGVANHVPLEVSTGQRFGDLSTQLLDAQNRLVDSWFDRVKGGEYNSDDLLAALRAADPNLPEDYTVNRSTFDKVLKSYMADGEQSPFAQMPEVQERVQTSTKILEQLDADKIDYGLADRSQLVDRITGERLDAPVSTATRELEALKKSYKEQQEALVALLKSKPPRGAIKEAHSQLKALDDEMKLKKDALKDAEVAFKEITPNSVAHKFAYEDGAHYLSRVFDKGRISANTTGFEDDLIAGWLARNPNVNPGDEAVIQDLRLMAKTVTNKLLNEADNVSLGDLTRNLDLPGNYAKSRTLNVDDAYITNWTHDDVTATQMYHASQAVVDVEMAKAGVKFEDMLTELDVEFRAKVDELNKKFGVNSPKALKAINALAEEKLLDISELKYAMRRLKRQSPEKAVGAMGTFETFVTQANRWSGMAQLGSSALPNSIADVASVSRSLGSIRTMKVIGQTMSPEFFKEVKANAKAMGTFSDLVEKYVRDEMMGEMAVGSLDPNRSFRTVGAQMADKASRSAQEIYGKVSLIDGWAKAGRLVATTASTQRVFDAAKKGFKNLSKQERTELAKFYIDEDMLGRIGKQLKNHGTDSNGVMFGAVENWDDAVAAETFKQSVYAHTMHSLNIPSIGSGSQFMSENLWGRILMRYKSFNNAAYESTFLQSLQNREVTRLATGAMNYAFWGMMRQIAYDAATGRDVSWDAYFGSPENLQKTAMKILIGGGFVASTADGAINILKTAKAGGPLKDAATAVVPDALQDEIFPKYADVSALEKIAGPAYGWGSKVLSTTVTVAEKKYNGEELNERDIHSIRTILPGQNIGWLRRGFDHVEEALGGRAADYNQNR